MKNLFFDLPVELIQKIYEFDSTHRDGYIDVLDSLPLVSEIKPFPGYERWVFVLITKQHSSSVKENLQRYISKKIGKGEYENFSFILETRRDVFIDFTLTKALFQFMKKFKI